MKRIRRLLLGGATLTVVIAVSAVLSAWPSYRALPEGMAVLKLSFSHGGDRSKSCRQLTEDEMAKLPANMRRTEICDRERPPLFVELDLDGETVFSESLAPSGIAGDGPSRVYERFVLPAGDHDVAIRLRDTVRPDGFDYSAERRISLAPEQNFVIDFSPVTEGFVFN